MKSEAHPRLKSFIVAALISAIGSSMADASASEELSAPTNVAPEVWAKIRPQLQAARYAFEADENGGFKASNSANGFEIVADAAGVRVQDGVVLRAMKTVARGVERVLPQDVRPTAEGARLEYQRGNVIEWFVNKEEGLEQGFTIEKPSDLSAGSDLQLLVDVGGARAVVVSADGLGARITDEQGRDFGYGGLKAWDATGRALTVRMRDSPQIEGCASQILLVCDTRDAVYPITIDPILTSMEKKLLASDGAVNDAFGSSVSVAGDVAIVGAVGDDSKGSAYVFERNAGGTNAWGQVAKLTAADGANEDNFGCSVSVAGDVAIVGAFGDDDLGDYSGSAYVFERNVGGTNVWGQVKKLTASDGATYGYGQFGVSVSVAGDVALVGAFGADTWKGSAYIFERNAGGTNAWGQVKKLTKSVRANYDDFGWSVCVAGDVALVGADGVNAQAGAAYVFERNAGGVGAWGEVAQLAASDGAAGDNFGSSVSVAGDVALVGAKNAALSTNAYAGAAYVFERNVGGTNAWGQVAKLTASDGAADDYFGCAVSMAGDVALVGANGVDVSTNANAGAAYAFERNAGGVGAWGEVAKLTASDGGEYNNFGLSVSVAGGMTLAGAQGNDSNKGAAYLVPIQYAVWLHASKLSAPDRAAEDSLGYSVSVAGDVALVGAPNADASAANEGAAYVYERNAGGTNAWGQVAKLTASDGEADDLFGCAVSVAGDVALVGACFDDDHGDGSGSAYVFERNAGGTNAWGQVVKLTATNGVIADRFGWSVSVAGDVAVVGANWADSDTISDTGAAYIFERNAGGTNAWGEVKKLTASDGAAYDFFGYSVSVDGDVVLVGANWGYDLSTRSGCAYVFERNAGGTNVWSEVKKLTASDGANGDNFGYSVSVAGDVALVGAYYNSAQGFHSGAAYCFERNVGGTNAWGEVAKLTASDGTNSDEFGCSVSVDGDVALVGAYRADPGGTSGAGAAYMFERNEGGTNAWGEVVILTAADRWTSDEFGNAVSVAGDVALVGAHQANVTVEDSGAAYVYQGLLYTPPTPDFTILGTNGTTITNGEAASAEKGTDFGTVIVGQGAVTNTFSITNSGLASLIISEAYTTGVSETRFVLLNLPSVIPAQTKAQFSVAFTPQAGQQNAALNFTHNATNIQFVLNLTGYGSGGGIKLSTNLLTYTATYEGSNPAEQIVRMTNVGVSAFTYTNVITYSAGADGWLTVRPDAGSVAVSGSVLLTNAVNIAGVDAGTYYATNRVTAADATNSPQIYVVALTVGKENQTITFPNPGAQLTTNRVGLSVYSSSGLAVTCAVASGSATITGFTNLVFTGAGSVTIVASQAGDGNYNAAPSVTNTFNVTKVVAGVTLNNLSQTYDGTPRVVTATTLPGGLTVDITYNGSGTAPTAVGSYAITGVVNEVMYQGSQTGTLAVAKADQSGLTFTPTSPQTFNTTNGLGASGGQSSGGWTFTVESGSAQIVGATNLWMRTGTGSVAVRATRAGDANWNAAYVEATVNAAKAGQTITFGAIADQLITNRVRLTATADSGLAVSFSVLSGPAAITGGTNLTFSGTGSVSIVASQAGNTNWTAAADVTNTFNVTKVVAIVTLINLTQAYDGTARVVGFTSVPPVASVLFTYDGIATAPTNVGTYSVTGVVNDLVYTGGATGTLTVTMGNQTIAWAKIPNQRLTNVVHLAATASSGLPVTFEVVSGPAALTNGTNVVFSDRGTVTVRASQAGDTQWNPVSTTQSFLVGRTANLDFDGDGRSDIGCYYAPGGNWYVFKSKEGFWQTAFGYAGTVPVTGDFDGDGLTDLGCYYAPGGNWYLYKSKEGFWQTAFGYAGTIPVTGDFDGDGKSDIGCYYPPGGNWYIFKSKDGFWQTQFGYAGTVPVTGDFDGDGKTDIGCYYAPGGNWYLRKSTEGFWQTAFGYAGTVPVTGDFDGDGKTDIGCYYAPGGNWYVFKSKEGFWQTAFGYAGTVPVTGDFDGDGKTDLGCYYAPGGNWYVFKSKEGFWQTTFGYSGTVPLQ